MLFGSRRPVTVLDEGCDRGGCPAPARVRVGKHIVTEIREGRPPDKPTPFGYDIPGSFVDAPVSVESREMDLVFCHNDYAVHHTALQEQGFRVLDDPR